MAEVIQCPACLMWLDMEMREAVVEGEYRGSLLYRCGKCEEVFTEYGEVIEMREVRR